MKLITGEVAPSWLTPTIEGAVAKCGMLQSAVELPSCATSKREAALPVGMMPTFNGKLLG